MRRCLKMHPRRAEAMRVLWLFPRVGKRTRVASRWRTGAQMLSAFPSAASDMMSPSARAHLTHPWLNSTNSTRAGRYVGIFTTCLWCIKQHRDDCVCILQCYFNLVKFPKHRVICSGFFSAMLPFHGVLAASHLNLIWVAKELGLVSLIHFCK